VTRAHGDKRRPESDTSFPSSGRAVLLLHANAPHPA
jgi:hypothetical protein